MYHLSILLIWWLLFNHSLNITKDLLTYQHSGLLRLTQKASDLSYSQLHQGMRGFIWQLFHFKPETGRQKLCLTFSSMIKYDKGRFVLLFNCHTVSTADVN